MQITLNSSRRSFLQGGAAVTAGIGLPVSATVAAGSANANRTSGPSIQLVQNTWPQVESYLKEADGIIVPIGSTEQHGPSGPLGTDSICAEIVAHEVARRTNTLVAPTLTIGMAQHHLAFPGTLSLQPSTLIAVINDLVRSLTTQGFRHIYFLNGHGGNVAIIQTAFQEFRAGSSLQGGTDGVLLRTDNWYSGRRSRELAQQLFGAGDGSHAKPSEISVAWYAWPESAQPAQSFEPEIAPRGSGPFGDARDFRARFPDGRIGANPSGANIEAGERLFQASVEDILESYQAFLAYR